MRVRLLHSFAALTVAALFAAAACSRGSATATTPQTAGGGGRGGGRGGQGGAAVPVTVAVVEQKPMPLAITAIGNAEAFHTVAVHAQMTGALTSVKFIEGDDVKQGQVIFELDRRPLEATLQQAQANLARDTAQATNSRASAERYQDLLTRGIATKEQADQARTAAEALDATLAADRAAIENAKLQLDYSTIVAPISGRTGALIVHEGNLVRANDATPLVVINQVSPIYVSFGIPEAQLPDLKRYMAQGTVSVQATTPNDTTPSEGRITFIDNAVDPTTGQIRIKASFPNTDRRLWPGQFDNVTITLKTDPNALVVPAAAVQNGQQGTYVFVITPTNTAELRNVSVERQVADTIVIKDGVKAGETVVTDGQLLLVGGARVNIKSGPGAHGEKVHP